MLRPHVDGIIVGSALVRKLEQVGIDGPGLGLNALEGLAQSLASALNP
jgi:tryptophan synthase alpha subunit